MRQILVLVLFLAVNIAAAPVMRAESGDPSDLFLNAYMAVQKAEKLEEDGKYKLALQKYRFAVGLLQQIRDKSPDWQAVIVAYRLNKTSEAIALLQKKIAVEGNGPMTPDVEPPLPESPGDNGAPATSSAGVAPAPAPRVDTSNGAGDAIDQVRADYERMKKELAEWKTKYADEERANAELTAKFEETRKQLDKARVDESQIQSQLEQAEQAYKNAVADKTKDSQGQKELKDEVARLQNELKDRDAERDAAADANQEAEHRVAVMRTERADAIKERDDAVNSLNKAKAGQQQVDKLMADNAALTEQLKAAEKSMADLKTSVPAKDAQIASLKKDLADARQQLTDAIKKSQENLDSMNDLQDQVEKATAELSQAKTAGASSGEAKQLAEENDLLRGIVKRERQEEAYRDQEKQLALAELAKLHVPSDAPLLQQLSDMTRPLKLTEQERALFKQTDVTISDEGVTIAAEKQPAGASPVTLPADPAPGTPEPRPSATPATDATTPTPAAAIAAPPLPAASPAASPATQPASENTDGGAPRVETSNIPPVSEELMPQAREAKHQFDLGNYRDAEKVYRAMMEQDPQNLYVLDNLGVVLFRSGKLKQAEEIFAKALVASPDDEFSNRTLGIVYYTEATEGADHNERKLDDAVKALTKALIINPKDAIGHNYLGITASAKGWQEAARKELETAVAINPNYADAHFNLAVIYLISPPVDKESARKHYKTALQLGSGADPSVEQMLNAPADAKR